MEVEKIHKNVKLWTNVAWVSGVFAFIVCFLLIANYLQYNRMDPVDVQTVNALVERLNQDPNDEALRIQIRELDLLARKAYFTNQWQIRMGGYLVLIASALLAISLQFISSNRKKIPEVDLDKKPDILANNKSARIWITIGGSSIIVIALVFAFLTHNNLGNIFIEASASAKTKTDEVVEIKTQEAPAEEQNAQNIEVETKEEETVPAVESPKTEIEDAVVESVIEEEPATTREVGKFPSDAELKKNFVAFRGYGGNAIDFHKNIPTQWDGASGENILWKSPIPMHGYNSPIIWGNKLFVSGADKTKKEIYCFDRNNGSLLWTAIVSNIQDSPNAPNVTGDTGHSAPSLTTDGERVYAIFSNGDIVAVDMNGKQIWGKNLGLPRNHYGHSSSMIMHQDKLIVQYDHGSSAQLMALAGTTGEEIWNVKRKVKISWASPIVVNTGSRDEIILVADPYTAGYDPETGTELWKVTGMSGEVGPSAAYADGMVFVLNEYAIMQAIKLGPTPTVVWEDYEYLSDVPSPIATKDYVFIPTSYGVMLCYEAKTGTKLWEQEFDNGFYSSPMLVEGKIYMMDLKGIMHIIKADKEFQLIASPKLGEKSECTPAFADGRIYIRAGNNLYCIGS